MEKTIRSEIGEGKIEEENGDASYHHSPLSGIADALQDKGLSC